MNNMYEILARLDTVSARHTLTEGRAVKEADVEEGNRFAHNVLKAKAAGKKQADLDGDGDMEPVKEAKKAKPDFLDVDDDKNRKESFKKAVADRARSKKSVKESLRLIHDTHHNGVRATIRHDREYNEYEVCVESDQGVRRAFADNRAAAHHLLENLMVEQAKSTSKDKPFFPRPGADDERTAFRKKHSPSVMRDPEAKGEVEKMDRDLDRLNKMRRGELDPDEMGDEPPAGEKRGRGRPKKYTSDKPRQERATAKARKADRTAWTPDRKKKKVKEQDMAEDYNQEQLDEISSDLALRAARRAEKKGQAHADDNLSSGPQIGYEYMQQAKRLQSGADKRRAKERDDEVQAALSPAKQRRMQAEDYDQDEYDEEGEMAQSQSRTIADAAAELESMLDADENLPEWVQKKISLAQEYIDSARDYLAANRPDQEMDESALQAYLGKKKYGKEGMAALQQAGREGASKERMAKIRARHDKLDEEPVNEKMASKAQNRLMRATAGGADTGVSPKVAREFIKKSHGQRVGDLPERVREGDIDPNRHPQTRDYGRGEDEPKAKKPAAKKPAEPKKPTKQADSEEKVSETTTSGSVATTPSGGEKKSKGGIQYGKGVYEARLAEQFERAMESVMTENLDVAVTANSDGTNTVTVTGKDVPPDVLQDLLQMAGMSGSREPVYQPVDSAMAGGDDMASMLDTLDGLSAGEPGSEPRHRDEIDADAEIMPEDTVCERCGGHQGMHEAGCDRAIAMEADLANGADKTETMSTDYMVDELAGGLNGPKLQSNPNNPGDNPLAMGRLGRHAGPNLNLGSVVEQVERDAEDRLLSLYRKIGS